MSEAKEKMSRNVKLGLIAGAVGGLAGAAAKVIAERYYPPRAPGEVPPNQVVASGVSEMTGHGALRSDERKTGGEVVHWVFGAVAGGVYGAVAEYVPQVTDGNGAAFGMMLDFATHESSLPWMGLAPAPGEQSARAHGSEAATHAVYGMTAEFVRKHLRSWLEERAVEKRRSIEAGRRASAARSESEEAGSYRGREEGSGSAAARKGKRRWGFAGVKSRQAYE